MENMETSSTLKTAKKAELPCNWRSYFGGLCLGNAPGTSGQTVSARFPQKTAGPELGKPGSARRSIQKHQLVAWTVESADSVSMQSSISRKNFHSKTIRLTARTDFPVFSYMLEGCNRYRRIPRRNAGDHTFKPHDAFSVGEVFNEKEEELPDFIGDNGYFSSMFDFSTTVFGGSPNGWYDHKDHHSGRLQGMLFPLPETCRRYWISVQYHRKP